ncbi:ATP-binding protein [Saccharopolyspora hattusasensis]|uniref:ATP-binding protein n=1 Tax=Saccharopolyspora hattusasensis TaxID=1128679 RepID=UPI003D97C92E
MSREGYRVVREGLTNTLRHAGRVRVAVRIAISPRALDLDMTNPLGSSTPRRGLGLDGIKRRAQALGGHAEGAAKGDNWQLQVHLPW